MKNTLIYKLKKYIQKLNGDVFTLSNFFSQKFDQYSYSSIKRTINELKTKGFIDQIMDGIYYKPKTLKALQTKALPNTEQVINAIAKKRQWEISPTGERSLNMLGLSTQQSFIYLYASTGPYRQYTINNVKVVFKRCKSSDLLGKSPITKVLIQAIKTLGKENIKTKQKNILKSKFDSQTKNIILNESRNTTLWIRNVIKEICGLK